MHLEMHRGRACQATDRADQRPARVLSWPCVYSPFVTLLKNRLENAQIISQTQLDPAATQVENIK